MRKVYIALSLFLFSPVLALKLFEKAKKGVKTATGSVKSAIKDPQKTVRDASLNALKVVGINLEGIVSNVNAVQDSIVVIKQDVKSGIQALHAPKSPLSKSKSITQKLNEFRNQAAKVSKIADISDVKRAMGSLAQLGKITEKGITGQAQTDLNNLYKTYESLIAELDSVELRPILHYARKTLYDLAGTLDSALRIRDYAGSLAQVVVPEKRVAIVRDVSKGLRTVAQNLNDIMQSGDRSVSSVQSELANALLSNPTQVPVLIANLQTSSKNIVPKMNQINTDIASAMKAKDRLIISSSSIGKRLELLIHNKMKSVVGAFDVPRAAVEELKSIMNEIRGDLDILLRDIGSAVANVADVIQTSSDGVNAFNQQIKFDIVSPKARVALDALPKSLRGLSSSIGKMRQAVTSGH